MTPWPEASYNHSPNMQQQPNSDPFASFGASPPGMPSQYNSQAPAPSSEAPPAPVAQQQPVAGNVDPWAAMMAPPPAQAPPMQAPPAAPVSGVQLTPPPTTVFADNQAPPSPMDDVSVLAAADNAYAAAQTAAANALAPPPSAAPSVSYLTQQGVQPLQPSPQLMQQPQLMQPAAPMQSPPVAQPAAPANPFDFGAVASAMPAAPPPAAMPPMAPPTPPTADFATTAVAQQQVVAQPTASPPLSPVPANQFAPQQGFADPFGYAFSPMTSPVTSPGPSPTASPTGAGSANAVVPSAAPNVDPFGVALPFMPGTQAPMAATQAVVPSAALSADPFGVFGSQPAPAPVNADPFGSSALVTAVAPAPAAGGAVDDPFGLFGAPTPVAAPAAAPVPTQAPVQQQTSADPWAAAGFGNQTTSQPQSQPANPTMEHSTSASSLQSKQDETPITLDSNNLPSDGEYYEARINARSLGAMFYTARNLEDTLFCKMPNNVIEALGSRPVVAYVAENSAAHNSGVHLGHVILSVNGHEISDPEYCANMIRNSPRPMNLRCYVPPNLELTLNEGKHMVKYDTKDLEAPGSSVEWKRKHIVVGGIVTKPWMMNMFYRKRDYDIAVKEAHCGQKISVKVKQFDLRGARIILKGKDGKPNWVDYPSEPKPWHYITILPNKGYPIKISAESMEELEPVYSAVRRFVKKDMEARYQYGMEESFSSMRSRPQSGTSRADSGSSGRSGSGGFNQFGDAQQHDDARHDHWK
eukprot:CAMPEP_0172306794 /NCGR_PEP_ID=MMETSP1058-20130122/7788_1 /TAXON_ID=83371 /ORGANISM="Detonula confervacea, Strain CCMP 353" /LENGTH=751 /DNA_ID=CAMNT_0013018787 /DNA_START=67 /DNA_END=2322 /DNA_ORIENTATION=+